MLGKMTKSITRKSALNFSVFCLMKRFEGFVLRVSNLLGFGGFCLFAFGRVCGWEFFACFFWL